MAERVQKILAAAGAGSRRKVEELIKSGEVAVNGSICKLGDKAEPEDTITVSGKEIDCRSETGGVILYNKPIGKIVSRSDPGKRPTVFEDLPPVKTRWVSVGRLDINSSGLLIFCTDGALAHGLTHPSREIEREYLSRVRGDTGEKTVEKLLSGIVLDGKRGRFEKVERIPGKEGSNKWFRITVREGRNRFVRRMWESCGCEISRLVRVRFGPVKLPAKLPPGACIFLGGRERDRLYKAAGAEPPPDLRKRV